MSNPQPTGVPARKVITGGAGGIVVSFLVLVLNTYFPIFIVKPISGEIASLAATIVSFFVAYLTPPAASETTVVNEDGNTRSASR